MRDIIKTGLILLVICAVAAFALAMTNEVTKDQIAMQRQLANDAAKAAVLPVATTFEDLDKAQNKEISEKFTSVAEGYIGYDADHNIVGYVFKSLPTGFGGAVEVVTGIDVEGTVTGMRMGNHQETPGLGARAKEPAYYEQYNGKSASGPIGVAKSNPTETDIQAITGATISSAAITSGVNASIDAYHFIMGN
ncbi:RnfABCDGE type electron transport complex subunit G [Fusibacter sp. 3D3]|uniref:RnfABCDGE type electron transport complex subunit G n=1 Tax=Fusibacter sp. 3D3 TaxID=1048380 RepID=UPI000852CE74|nr:RnfABCDGE type electron transport complex subunit G [Fusibacter sp. 3D3]GAU77410.1 electron transport complex protein RnfG [Fusibacter sp. 3D3]